MELGKRPLFITRLSTIKGCNNCSSPQSGMYSHTLFDDYLNGLGFLISKIQLSMLFEEELKGVYLWNWFQKSIFSIDIL